MVVLDQLHRGGQAGAKGVVRGTCSTPTKETEKCSPFKTFGRINKVTQNTRKSISVAGKFIVCLLHFSTICPKKLLK